MATRQTYSRLASVEERRAKRALFIYGGLTIGLILIVIFFGFGLASRFANVINRSGTSNNPISILDKTPPAPPRLDSNVEFTNKTKLTIEGSAEAGTTVNLKINGDLEDIVANADGRFSTSLDLDKGENTISAVATDQAGNESAVSNTLTIIYDDEPPKLSVSKPKSGDSFSGKDKSVSVEGATDQGAEVTINDRIAIVSSDGRFNYSYGLNNGENALIIKATDQAGNEIEETITVTYSP